MPHNEVILFVVVCTLVVTCSAQALSAFLNITKLERELKMNIYFSPHYCGLSQTLHLLAPVTTIPCGLRFRLLAETKHPVEWYPVIETLPSFGRLWLLKSAKRLFDTPIDQAPYPLTEFASRTTVNAPEDEDIRSTLYWEPDRYSANQYLQSTNPNPSLRDVTRGMFKWYAEEALSKNRTWSQTMSLAGFPVREPPAPGGKGAMGNFNGINSFIVLQPIAVGLKELDISLWIKCNSYSNNQVIMFAEAQAQNQPQSDNVDEQTCESKVYFSIFETSNIKVSILGKKPVSTGLSVCNPNQIASWHYLRVTMKQLQSNPSNSAANGLTISVSVDLGVPFIFNSTALPLISSRVSFGADTRCDSTPRGSCVDSKNRVLTCMQPFSGMLDEIRFFDRIRPIDYVLWDWKRGWSNIEIEFYHRYAVINTLYSLTFEEVDSYGKSQIWGNNIPDYYPTIFPTTSPVFSFNQSFHTIEISPSRVPKSRGCGVNAIYSVLQFRPVFIDVQSISIQSIIVTEQPSRGCALTLKKISDGFKEGNLIQATTLDLLYTYYGIYGSNAYRQVSLGSFYDTFILEGISDLNSDKLSSFGLVTLLASPGVSWDDGLTYSMFQDTTMIFSPKIFNVEYESIQIQIWTDPLPDCLFQVVSFDESGKYVLGERLKPGDYISHPKFLVAFTPPKHKTYPKQQLVFSALKYEFKVTYSANPTAPIYKCKVDLSTSCNTGSFFINVEAIKSAPSWTSGSLVSFDVVAEGQFVVSMLFEDPDSSDFLISVHQYPSKGKLYEFSAAGGLGSPLPVSSDVIVESWITALLDTSDSSMIQDEEKLIGKFQLDEHLTSLTKSIVLNRGNLCSLTFQFGNTPIFVSGVSIYGDFSDQTYVWIEGSNFGDAMSKNDQDWFLLFSGYLQTANITQKNAVNFSSQVPFVKDKHSLLFCPQRSKSSNIFRFRFMVPSKSPLAFVSSIFVNGTAAPPKHGFKTFDVIDAAIGTYRSRFIYVAPVQFYGEISMIIALTDCNSQPVLKNITFNIVPIKFPAVPAVVSRNITSIASETITVSFEGNSIQNSNFDIVFLGSDAPLMVQHANRSITKGSILTNHTTLGANVYITPPADAGGFPYAVVLYGFLDNGIQSPWVGQVSMYVNCRMSFYHFQRSCISCPFGHFCDIFGLLEPKPCPAGTYAESEGKMSCDLCLPGTYTDKVGSVNCLPCEKGTFNAHFGSTKCLPCEKGFSTNKLGSSSCSLCPKGTYSDALGQPNCKTCPDFSDTDLAFLSDSSTKCKCKSGAFFNGKECVECCYGAVCKGYNVQPAARVGFWTDVTLWPTTSCHFMTCDNINDCKSEEFEIYENSAPTFPLTANTTSAAWNLSSSKTTFKSTSKGPPANCADLRTSKLCFSCETGYYKDSFGTCHSCDDQYIMITFAWKSLVLIILLAMFVYSCWSKLRSTYILYSLLQSMCFISRLPLNWSTAARLPFSIAWVFFLKTDFLPLSCWKIFIPNTESGSIRETQAYLYILAIPCALSSGFLLLILIKFKNYTAPIFRLTFQNLDLVNSQQSIQEWPIIYRILADEIDPRRIDFWKRSAIHVINVAFCNMLLISSVSALDLLACKDLMHDGSTGYLLLDPEVDCKSDSKIILRPFLIFFILFSALIYPVFCSLKIIKLHKGNHYHDEMMVHMYGNLFMRYKREVYWWEITILCKKSFLILALASFADSTLLLMASVLMILSISLIGTVYFKPYRSNLENNADLFSTFSQILIMFAGMYFYSVISFDPNKANSTFFFYVREADICVWIIAVAIAVAILLCIYKDSYQLFEETGIKSIFLRLISISPQSERAAQDRLLKTAFLECDSDLMWRYGSSKNQKTVAAIEANSEGNQLNQNTSEFQNTSGAVALIQRQVLTVSSENKGLIAKISKLEMHYKSLKEDEEKRKKTTDDLEKVTEEAKRAISFLEVLKQDCDERVEKSQYWSEMLQSTRMQRQSLEKELLASKKMERSHALLIRTVNSQFNKADPTKTEKS